METSDQTESIPYKLNEEIRIKIVTDMDELIRKGHKYPVVELYNDVIDTWIPITELSFSSLQHEITHIEKVTGWYKTKRGDI